jgi:hypothetical protein
MVPLASHTSQLKLPRENLCFAARSSLLRYQMQSYAGARWRHHPVTARMGCRIATALALTFAVVSFVRADEHVAASRSVGRFSPSPAMAPYERVAFAAPDAGQEEHHLLPPLGDRFEVAADSDLDKYLCSVYRRMPHKIDGAGDFSWKDRAAASRSLRTVCDYAINGMHGDLRESLYVLGRYADEAGLNWPFLSAFRDDYRQSIAAGFKASTCGSLHGGSCRTQGWGDGRAADLWVSDRNGYPADSASSLLDLIDRLGPSLGLSRPMPGADPSHVQVSGDWQAIGKRLRAERLRSETKAASGR